MLSNEQLLDVVKNRLTTATQLMDQGHPEAVTTELRNLHRDLSEAFPLEPLEQPVPKKPDGDSRTG